LGPTAVNERETTHFGWLRHAAAKAWSRVAPVHTARLRLRDEVAEERGAGRKRQMIDVAVQGLVHAEHELRHTHFLS
jgi:hypothetical protein